MQELFPTCGKCNMMDLNSVMTLSHVANPCVHMTTDTFQQAQKSWKKEPLNFKVCHGFIPVPYEAVMWFSTVTEDVSRESHDHTLNLFLHKEMKPGDSSC